MKKYAILGQSNYAVAIILDTLAACEKESFSVDIVANIPNELNDSRLFPYAYLGVKTREIFHSDWKSTDYDGYFVGSIGKARSAIVSFFGENFNIKSKQFTTLIHPSSVCAEMVAHGFGVHVSALSVVAPYAVLGDFVVINRNCSVGHHTVLGDFSTLNPGVNVAGCCHIGRGVTIGMGATILDSLTIGSGSIIGAGSVVTKDVPENVVVYGVPAKIIRQL
jgi:sugar O-acyltransferase (sialic acid O-acetyltransferase NeuD family)